MKIADKYATTNSEKAELLSVSEFSNAETAFENHCSVLILRAYFKAINERKLQPAWNEVTITRHLKKQLKQCIKEEEVQYFIAPEYPEDDDEIDDGSKDAAGEVFFDLMFCSFNSTGKHHFGIEAKIVVENNYLKRIATTEIVEYISAKGMRKFIEGIYKKRGCMIGYVVEGRPEIIVEKINQRIKADSFYTESAILKKKESIDDYEHHYESIHLGYLTNPLKHLFLDFTLKK